MANVQEARQTSAMDREITVHTIGNGGVEDLSVRMDDLALSWALLRCETNNGTSGQDKMVAVACHGVSMSVEDREQMLSLSARVLHLFGKADITLQVTSGKELPQRLYEALANGDDSGRTDVKEPVTELPVGVQKADEALRALADESSSHNWILLEPTKLELHRAGCAGLDELKEWLPADKVMFGALRFSFPRTHSAPPIVKYLFIHWIGPKVSVIRRGQWNSKLEGAALKMRSSFDCAFRKTAYTLEDLELPDLIDELGRVTCITSADTRQFSVDWYLEGLVLARQSVARPPTKVKPVPACGGDAPDSESQSPFKPFLRKSAQDAIQVVREHGRQLTWVLLTPIKERGSPSSGGLPHTGGA